MQLISNYLASVSALCRPSEGETGACLSKQEASGARRPTKSLRKTDDNSCLLIVRQRDENTNRLLRQPMKNKKMFLNKAVRFHRAYCGKMSERRGARSSMPTVPRPEGAPPAGSSVATPGSPARRAAAFQGRTNRAPGGSRRTARTEKHACRRHGICVKVQEQLVFDKTRSAELYDAIWSKGVVQRTKHKIWMSEWLLEFDRFLFSTLNISPRLD